MNYQPVIGLEIHCELLTASKIFCSCKNGFGGEANTRVCPVCSGMPGALPILNKNAVYLAAKAGLALDCTINKHSAFDRKNYFYPDLPKAYQITQFAYPLCSDGFIDLSSGKRIRINRIHIEEDAGKLVHEDKLSMIDYNRCGVPLIEIVTEPDFNSAAEVIDFVRQTAQRLRYADVCDGRMEQGSLRVDVNISLMPCGSQTPGTRAEIKNLNSTKSIAKAIDFEIKRQTEILNSGGRIIQETRRFNERTCDTLPLRSKEELHDYRYFPEPDIPSVSLTDEEIAKIRDDMPELPHQREARYIKEYGLTPDDAQLISSQKSFSDFYNEAVTLVPEHKIIAKLMLGEVSRCINESGDDIKSAQISPSDIAKTAQLVKDNVVSNGAAKEIISILFYKGGNPEQTAKDNGFIINDNPDELSDVINTVLQDNIELVTQYKNGEQKLFGFIMGQAMRKCGKGANPALIKEILYKKLEDKEN